MITPRFEVTQNSSFVSILLRTPYIKANEAEIFVDGRNVKFYCKPYFIKLFLPADVIDDTSSSATFDIDAGIFTIQLSKSVEGQYFDNLDLLTSLLAPKTSLSKGPLIEVLDGAATEDAGSDHGVDELQPEEEYDWEIEQQMPEDDNEELKLNGYRYGFAGKKSGIFSALQGEMGDAIEVGQPDTVSPAERKRLRLLTEDEKFDPEHFLADYYDCDALPSILQFKPHWEISIKKHEDKYKEHLYPESVDMLSIRSSKGFLRFIHEEEKREPLKFTSEEKDLLQKLPNKDYLLDANEERCALLALVDIMYAYCYDHRTTEGEHTTESCWTICKLSSALSWLEEFSSIEAVSGACFHRSLCYPLYRNHSLSAKCWQDVQELFALGRRHLLRCLLDIYGVLQSSETFHIHNDLFINDYCIWLQRFVSHQRIQSLALALQPVCVEMNAIRFDLRSLVTAADMVCVEDRERTDSEISSESSSDLDSDDDDHAGH